MILNIEKEGEIISNNILQKAKNDALELSQLKRIKELLNEKDLMYVSSNIRDLLNIEKTNDPNCFVMNSKSKQQRVVQVGEKFRVILYIRLSQEDGDLEDGDVSGSIKNQLLYLLDECEKRDWKVVGIFCEEDISGVDDNRPEWLKSIRFAEVGNTEIVLCKSQSRFTRSMEMVEKYLHKCFPEWNVRFLGLVDNSDTSKVEGKKSRQINGLVNEWYVEDTSINTRATLRSMKKNGQFTGSFAPYGYEIDPKDKHHLVPDLYARESIILMAEMIKIGKSPQEVCKELMKRHYLTPADYKRAKGIRVTKKMIKSITYQIEKNETLKTIAEEFYSSEEELMSINNLNTNEVKEGQIIKIPHKQKWTPRMIREILTDETQIGTLVQGKVERKSFKNKKIVIKPKEEWIRVPHCHEANLDLDTFTRVGKMFIKKTRNRVQKDGTLQLFTKKVYCACCGKPLQKNTAGKEIKKEYLVCKSNSSVDGHVCDNTKAVELNEFKKYILNCINEKINKYYELSKLSDEYYIQNIYNNIDHDLQNINKEKNKLQTEIEKNRNILVQLYADKVAGNITLEEFNLIKRSNEIQLENTNAKINNLSIRESRLIEEREKQKNQVEIFEKYKNLKELNKVVLDTFINKIEIGKNVEGTGQRSITIEWNFYTK